MPFAPGRGSLPPFEFFTKPTTPGRGRISGSAVIYTTTQPINLTSLGGIDWATFGYNVNAASIERKSTGGSQISALSQVGGTALGSSNHGASINWSCSWTGDGTPDATIASEGYQVFCTSSTVGNGMSFTVPADTVSRTLLIFVWLNFNVGALLQGKLTATLSDASAPVYVDTTIQQTNGSAIILGKYSITYNAASAGQTLAIKWTNNTSASGQSVGIFAATLITQVPVALSAVSGVFSASLAAVSGVVPLAARTMAAAIGRASYATALALLGYSSSGAAGRIGATVSLALMATGKAAAIEAAAFTGAIRLLAVGGMAAAGRYGSKVAAALWAYTASAAFGRAAPTGKSALASTGAGRATARVAISTLAAGQVALAAIGRASARGIAFVAGAIPLSARDKTSATAKSAARVAAWLSAISGGRGQASAPIKGVLTLTSASSARGVGLSLPAVRLPLTSISAFGRSIATAFGALFLKRQLFVDPNYIVQYQAPFRIVQYSDTDRIAQYLAPIRSVSYPGD